MPREKRNSDCTGPMGMQPLERGLIAPTQMQPIMPSARGNAAAETGDETNAPPPETKKRTRAEAIRAVLARITRLNSLRKQRQAQKR
jgi:hypothetical protein